MLVEALPESDRAAMVPGCGVEEVWHLIEVEPSFIQFDTTFSVLTVPNSSDITREIADTHDVQLVL